MPSGGWPRPSFRWQLWQARALKIGPSPSDACVDDGAETQTLRKMPLPSLNVPSSSKVMLAEDCEKASWFTRLREVPAPPCISSNCSDFEKSVAGRVMATTRARSAVETSSRVVARPGDVASTASATAAPEMPASIDDRDPNHPLAGERASVWIGQAGMRTRPRTAQSIDDAPHSSYLFGLVRGVGVELAVFAVADISQQAELRLEEVDVTLLVLQQILEQLHGHVVAQFLADLAGLPV